MADDKTGETTTNPDTSAEATAAAAAAAAAGDKSGDKAAAGDQAGKEGDAGTKTQDGTDTSGNKDAKQAAADTAKVPETYAFTIPEGSLFSEEDYGKFAAEAKVLGLSQERFTEWVAAREEQLGAINDQMLTDLKADPELGGGKFDETVAQVNAARKAMWPPGSRFAAEVDALFDKYGLGNHKGLADGFVRIGRLVSEDTGEAGKKQGGGEEKTRAQRMYPNQK